MKFKKFLSLILLAFVAICLVACGSSEDTQKIANDYLDKISITYAEGDSQTSVTKDVKLGTLNASDLSISWTSENGSVISATGKVTRGETDINVKLTLKVTYKEADATKDFTLTVKAKEVEEVKPLNVKISGDTKMAIGSTYQLTAEVKPDDATDKSVTWSSDAEAIATVDKDGKVTAIAAGNATITATCVADNTIKGTLAIEVVGPTADTIAKTLTKAKGEEGWTKGTVVGVYARGFMLYDGTGYIVVYMDKTAFTQKMGDYVEVKGVLDEYQGSKQFTATATVTALTEGTDYKLTAANADDAAVAALIETPVIGTKIKVRITVSSKSESYINATVKGGTSAIAVTYPVDASIYEVDADYDITAIVLYAKDNGGTKNLYVMTEKVTKVDYGYDVSITYKDGTNEFTDKINSLEFPLYDLNVPAAKEGQVFLGWYKGTEEKPIKVTCIFAPEDTTLFARWCAAEDAPIVVNPNAEEGSGQYTSLAAAIAAAKEGQTIELLAGEYSDEVLLLVERTYASWDAVVEAFMVDFNAVKSTSKTAAEIDTDKMESSDFAAIMGDETFRTKWLWLLKGIYEVAGYPENCDPETCTWTEGAVKQFYMANLNGALTKAQHMDTHFKYTSYNWANENDVNKVFAYCEKKDATQEDSTIAQIIVDKKVNIIGPNVNVHGHDEERNEEANIVCKFIVSANGVTVNGLSFTAEGMFELKECKNVTIDNCYFQTDTYGNTGVNNRKASIYNNGYLEDIIIRNTCVIFAGISYVNVAIDFDSDGITNFTLENCYLENTATAPQIYEGFMSYNIMGVFNFINNEFHVGIDGYVIRLGFNNTSCSEINIIGNKFGPLGDIATATIGFNSMDARNGMVINIIGNEFENFGPSTFTFAGANAAGAVVNYMYNYFDDQNKFKVADVSALGITFNHDYNCTLGELDAGNALDIKTEEHGFTTKEALDAAFAEYQKSLHTVKFDTDGGYEVYQIVFTDYKTVQLPQAKKDGFSFLGWYVGDVQYDELTENADITLKAKWGKVYTITFDCDGGTPIDPIQYGSVKGLVLPTAVKEGFLLEGWYDGDTKVEKLTELKDITLKAKWAVPYTITFDCDGGIEIADYKFLDFNKVVLPTPVKSGFFFQGWVDGSNPAAITENKDYALKATWKTVTALVVDPNGVDTYKTIQSAIDAATEGDIINVTAGVYDETINITKNYITIIGAKSYNFEHSDSYTPDATDTQIKGITVSGVNGFVIKQVVLNGGVNASKFKGLTVENVFMTTGTIKTTDTNSDLVVKDLFYAGSSDRIVYVYNGKLTNLTADRIIVMDCCKVTMGEDGSYVDGICDVIRIGVDNNIYADGKIIVKNCYMRAGQCGFQERYPNADYYEFTNNYFLTIRGAIYLRNGDITKPMEYIFMYNTFVECGNSIKGPDWDTLSLTTNKDSIVTIKYNAFVNCFKWSGAASAYNIYIRSTDGTIDCGKNYFLNDSDYEKVVNATGLSKIVLSTDESDIVKADKVYDPYTIMEYNNKVVVYGVNFKLSTANVKLDEAASEEVVVGSYVLPTPVKEGYEFQGWYEGDNKVTEITEAKDYVLVSQWKKLSVFNNMDGATMSYINREEFINEFIKDLNECKEANYKLSTLPDGAWTLVGLDTFFLDSRYSAKYLPFIKYIGENSNTASSCAGQVTILYNGLTGNGGEVATTVQQLVDNYGWKTDSSPYALQYEVFGWIFGKQHTSNTNFYSADYSQDALKYGLADEYAPTKEGYTFGGWYMDAEFQTPVTGELSKYDQVYYAQWLAQ